MVSDVVEFDEAVPMSARTAITRLCEMVAAVVPLDAEADVGAGFWLYPAAEPDKVPRSRGFWLELRRLMHRQHMVAGTPFDVEAELDVVIAYRAGQRQQELTLQMANDHTSVGRGLLDSSTWQTVSSTLHLVSGPAGVRGIPAEIEVLDNRIRLMRLKTRIIYTET